MIERAAEAAQTAFPRQRVGTRTHFNPGLTPTLRRRGPVRHRADAIHQGGMADGDGQTSSISNPTTFRLARLNSTPIK